MKTADALAALRELGFKPLAWLALYRFGLWTGHYRRSTPLDPTPPPACSLKPPLPLPDPVVLSSIIGDQRAELFHEADDITQGQVRLFGGSAVPLQLAPPSPLRHWTEYETGRAAWGVEDVKFLWEPARFGWALTLARAYQINPVSGYAQCFADQYSVFRQTNPFSLGPNWTSGQEIALRIIALSQAAAVFSPGTAYSPWLVHTIAVDIALSAARLPLTLPYARAQRNNHLLSEAAGLFTAGCVLPEHPQSARWRDQGWRIFDNALKDQVAADGTYIQQSSNYHRLMLQLALWMFALGRRHKNHFSQEAQQRLIAATHWLAQRTDPETGLAPNLGNNDGALLFPLASGGFSDYRPTVQAACRAFMGLPCYPPGPWDELSCWLDLPLKSKPIPAPPLRSPACMRAIHYTSRPAHADQLHVELWRSGRPLTLDPGTYRYTSASPWDNALNSAKVHCVVTVDGEEPMRRAGRFLWLNWDQAIWLEGQPGAARQVAEHTGYRRLGIRHIRSLIQLEDRQWQVTDELLPLRGADENHIARVHWLLPDAPYQLEGTTLRLDHSDGPFTVSVFSNNSPHQIELIRAGNNLLDSTRVTPILGWVSPTYGQKDPALSFAVTYQGSLPLVVSTILTM